MSLFATKPISQIIAEASETGTHTLKKTLTALDLAEKRNVVAAAPEIPTQPEPTPGASPAANTRASLPRQRGPTGQ